MRDAYTHLYQDALIVKDADVRRVLLEFARNYKAKLDAVMDLRSAVAAGDAAAERRAAVALRRASNAGQRMAEHLLDLIRPYYSGEELQRILRERQALAAQ